MRENLETVVIDILASEFLIKRNDDDTYSKYIQKVYDLDQFDKELLKTGFIVRQLHYSSIGKNCAGTFFANIHPFLKNGPAQFFPILELDILYVN